MLLHCGARIDHREFMRAGIEDFFAQRMGGEIDAIAAQRTRRFCLAHFALHELVEQGIVRREMIGGVVADEIGDDLAAVAIGVECVPHEGGGRFEKLRRAAVARNDHHLIAVLGLP